MSKTTIVISVDERIADLWKKYNKKIAEARKKSGRINLSRLAEEALLEELVLFGLLTEEQAAELARP